jgi:leucyl-tRNA synthetase
MQALAHKNDKLNLTEPFKGLFTQGMVCHETYKDPDNNWISPDEIITINGKKYLQKDQNKEVVVGPSESMSKSKKNTVDPENIIKNYGADSVRLFILSDSPPEKDIQWSDEGIVASFKFIQKLWSLHLKILEQINKNNNNDIDQELARFTNQFIKKISTGLENFNYNIIIANMHEMNSLLNKIIDKGYSKNTILENYKKILIAIMPVLPHLSNECLSSIGEQDKIEWPKFDEKKIEEDKNLVVIQINGKKRGLLEVKKNLDEETLIKLIKKDQKIMKYLLDKTIKKKIYIKNKILNIIV